MTDHANTPRTLFSRRLKAAREEFGISQTELGVRAGIDEYCASARINQYERGKHTPDFLTAQNLAKVLGIPTAYFYADDDFLATLLQHYGNLKISEKKELVQFVQSISNKPSI